MKGVQPQLLLSMHDFSCPVGTAVFSDGILVMAGNSRHGLPDENICFFFEWSSQVYHRPEAPQDDGQAPRPLIGASIRGH